MTRGAETGPPVAEVADVAVIPFDPGFAANGIFGGAGPERDGVLAPWRRVRDLLAGRGVRLRTADMPGRAPIAWLHLDAAGPPPADAPRERTVAMVFEPEVVAPFWYDAIRGGRLLADRVYVMSEVLGDGARVRRFRFPQVLTPAPTPPTERDIDLVMINGRKYATRRDGELYTTREKLAARLAVTDSIRVYGTGWGRIDPRHPQSTIRNLAIRRVARGPTPAKADVLSRARFALCLENAIHPGYHTEKLFDAMSAGAIPIYLGDPGIRTSVPQGFVDYRDLGSARAVREFVTRVSPDEEDRLRCAAQEFLASPAFEPYRLENFAQLVVGALEEAAGGHFP